VRKLRISRISQTPSITNAHHVVEHDGTQRIKKNETSFFFFVHRFTKNEKVDSHHYHHLKQDMDQLIVDDVIKRIIEISNDFWTACALASTTKRFRAYWPSLVKTLPPSVEAIIEPKYVNIFSNLTSLDLHNNFTGFDLRAIKPTILSKLTSLELSHYHSPLKLGTAKPTHVHRIYHQFKHSHSSIT
jgi:hypothetical protein